jgi:drug/metabolite transporter (DMT)-like permease
LAGLVLGGGDVRAGHISPILTVVWGALLFDEVLTPGLFLGGVLTLGGVSWAGRRLGQTADRETEVARTVRGDASHKSRVPWEIAEAN